MRHHKLGLLLKVKNHFAFRFRFASFHFRFASVSQHFIYVSLFASVSLHFIFRFASYFDVSQRCETSEKTTFFRIDAKRFSLRFRPFRFRTENERRTLLSGLPSGLLGLPFSLLSLPPGLRHNFSVHLVGILIILREGCAQCFPQLLYRLLELILG